MSDIVPKTLHTPPFCSFDSPIELWYTLQKVGQDIETKCLRIATIKKVAVDVRRNWVLQSIQQKVVRNFFQVTEQALEK